MLKIAEALEADWAETSYSVLACSLLPPKTKKGLKGSERDSGRTGGRAECVVPTAAGRGVPLSPPVPVVPPVQTKGNPV